MPAVPKKKTSKARKNMRRTHDRLEIGAIVLCSHCHRPQRAHHVCPHCGYYNGREVIPEKPARVEA